MNNLWDEPSRRGSVRFADGQALREQLAARKMAGADKENRARARARAEKAGRQSVPRAFGRTA